MEIKQVIVARKDLNLRKGKWMAQAAHASMKVFFDRSKTYWEGTIEEPQLKIILKTEITEEMKDWMDGNYKKIVVYVENNSELLRVYNQAKDESLPCVLVRDEALTELKEPGFTCCAIGPAKEDLIDKITRELPLL